MGTTVFTENDLVDVILRSAGDDDEIPFTVDNIDDSFEDVGLDSLAIMECLSLMKRELEIALDAGVVDAVETPRDLLDIANEYLRENAA
ncbi:acyl carrier protein [Antrihabitans cavernicola]|uniref:Acyl carrier protein n=1 Tax=Antrihabitans cavernicola TaxID=2495913 RepID=A0A5A7SBR7_9NOCA|nr:acyl carrier protein [Spelaeibacter cavernicola]KAA0021671.1 acyl carrier protein [Spelaeibacter cavernicola]